MKDLKQSKITIMKKIALYIIRYSRLLHSRVYLNSRFNKKELIRSNSFTIEYWACDEYNARIILEYLTEKRIAISKALMIDSITEINICLCKNKDELHELRKLNYIAVPGWLVGFAEGPKQMSLVSPFSFSLLIEGNGIDTMMKVAVHEMVHCLVRQMSTSKNIVKWLDEGIAMFFAEQRKGNLFLMRALNDNIFNLEELSKSGDVKIYDIGYHIIEFICDKWGVEKLRLLIQNDGSIEEVLAIHHKEFSHQFKEYIKQRLNQNFA